MTCLPPKSTGSQESSRFNIQLLGALPLIGSTQQPFLCAFLKKKKETICQSPGRTLLCYKYTSTHTTQNEDVQLPITAGNLN